MKENVNISSLSKQGYLPNINRNRRFIECSIDGVDRNRIEGICCITADINNNTQPTGFARFGNRFMRDKWRDLRAEVNAVHKDINIEDFVKGATLGCLRQVPLEDVVTDRIKNALITISREKIRKAYSSSPILLKKSTAPRPQRPRAPITRALAPLPLPPNRCLTSATIADSLSYGDKKPRVSPLR